MTAAAAGEAGAADRLFPLVLDQLRAIAAQRMAGERAGHTLQATALVNEAFVRLVHAGRAGSPAAGEAGGGGWNSRAQFFFAAARAMEQILVEHARAKGRLKRGGGRARVPLSVVDLAEEADEREILALTGTLRRLEERDPRAASIVRLRFFAGLGVDETAQALGLSERTVKREWAFARAWLFAELQKQDGL